LAYLTALLDMGPRESATEQELAAAEYLASEFESMGYSVEVQPFTVELLSPRLSAVTLDTPDAERIEAVPLANSATGDVSGPLVPVGLATREDLPPGGLRGKIALAKRGLITFEEKVSRATGAGAIGVIIYNNAPGTFQGALLRPGSIPAAAISQEDGQRIEALLASGDLRARISVRTETYLTQNVVADWRGTGEDVVVLGAHYDTVAAVAGASDNTSGAAVLLALARELPQVPHPFRLRFIAFGSEELGLKGSQFYVDSLSAEERRRIVAMLNFDALGSGSSLGILGVRELTDRVLESGARLGIGIARSGGLQGGSSDHATFEGVGVPVIMFFSDDFSRIHTAEDTLEFINPKLLEDAVRLGLELIRQLAASPPSGR
jgi:aminopeptidase YwaD